MFGYVSDADGVHDRVSDHWDWFSVSLFLLLSVDLLTTFGAYRIYGEEAEANPIMRAVLEDGIGTVVGVHLVALVASVVAFHGLMRLVEDAGPRSRRFLVIVLDAYLGVLVAAGLFVTANNLAVVVLGDSLV